MTHLDRRLARQLGLAMLVKLALLAVLWWAFVRPVHIDVSAQGLSARIGATPLQQGETR
ncbi:MAG TPA: hypothetical protein VNW98_01245 [Burkholderiaceae bacterium]|nr:hypothetical protein [Burkholderiaceae bacterium]